MTQSKNVFELMAMVERNIEFAGQVSGRPVLILKFSGMYQLSKYYMFAPQWVKLGGKIKESAGKNSVEVEAWFEQSDSIFALYYHPLSCETFSDKNKLLFAFDRSLLGQRTEREIIRQNGKIARVNESYVEVEFQIGY